MPTNHWREIFDPVAHIFLNSNVRYKRNILTTQEFIIEILKLIKPNFHNKITWFLVLFGASLIGTPLLERIINAIFETQFSISITEDNDIVVGLVIIGIGLVYNVLTNYFDKYLLHIQTIKKLDNNASQDKSLYERFLLALPSNGSMDFLKHHDFHNSFPLNDLRQIINFPQEWDNAECEFMNNDLEEIRKELLEKIKHFVYDSSMKTFPAGDGIQTIMTYADEEWDLTENTQKNIALLNQYGDDIYELHQKLIRKGRNVLYI